jgi:hypothetical protein
MAVKTFIPTIWEARLLESLKNVQVAANLVNRDYQGNITGQGDTVTINSIGAITVADYKKNTDVSDPQELTTSDTKLVIDQAKYFNFQVDDVDAAQAAGNLVDAAMTEAAYALNDAADAYILSQIAAGATTANTNKGVALTSDNVYENMVKLATILDKNNVPNEGRSVVVPPDVYALLLLDDRFVKASDGATANGVLLNGQVGSVDGLTVYKSNNVYSTGSTTKTFTVTAQVPSACTFAEQIVKTEAYRIEKRFADAVKGLHVYGAKVTRPDAIAAMTCTVGASA